jgi:hypothetical protein
MRHYRRHIKKHQLQLAGEEIGERGSNAFIVDPHDVDASHRFE